MNEDLISVIVPVYNAEKYLASCLDSILSQSYKNLELIIINDGSTDFSLKIAETYAEKDDRVIVYSYENEGQAEARNHGLSVATGEFITFVDADDVLLPNALELLYSVISEYSVDLVEGKVIYGEIYSKATVNKGKKVDILSPSEAIEKVLYQDQMLSSPCGKLYKRSLFSGTSFVKGIIYEDLDIFYKIFDKANKIAYVDQPVYFYRDNDTSTVNTWKPQRLDVLKVTQDLENYIEAKYPELLPAAKDRRLSANFNMFALCSIHGDKENASKCWEHITKNRKASFFNPKVRIKNKAGIALSYLGKHPFKIFSRMVYK